MASFFGGKAQSQPTKIVPHGGLGGLVSPKSSTGEHNDVKLDLKLLGKPRHRAPPLRILSGISSPMPSPAHASAVSSVELGGLWTPITPSDHQKHSLLGNETEAVYSPVAATPNGVLASPPQTPTYPKAASLAELPGSLLLASQGFPQTFPISPPPSIRLLRRDTEESTLSSVPSLCTTNSSDEDTMDALKSFTTRKHDRYATATPSSYTYGSGGPTTTKPIAVMTIAELLSILPSCDPETVAEHWLPTMRMQYERMKGALEEASQVQIDKAVDQVKLNEALFGFSEAVRAVSTDFRKLVDTAGSLAERDSSAKDERITILEQQVQVAGEMLRHRNKTIGNEPQRMAELRDTIRDVTRTLGDFIRKHLPGWADIDDDSDAQYLLQNMTGEGLTGGPDPVVYIRVHEAILNKHIADLREARDRIAEHEKTCHDHTQFMQNQSQRFDEVTAKLDKAVKLVQVKEHEVVLLVQQNDDLSQQLHDQDAAARIASQESSAAVDHANRRYDELRGNMNSLSTAHELELDQKNTELDEKNAEIAHLKQMLGSARVEADAHREDAKIVLAQSQAKLEAQAAASRPAVSKSSGASKALKFFGMERDKHRKANMPASKSTLGLSTIDTGYSTKEVAPAVNKQVLRHKSSLQGPAPLRPTRPPPPFDYNSAWVEAVQGHTQYRPRKDSLGPAPPQFVSQAGHYHGSNPVSPVSPINKNKPLPKHPVEVPQVTSARLTDLTSRADSPLQAQITSDFFSHGIMGQTAQSHRVLSRITEASTPVSHASDRTVTPRLGHAREDNRSDHSAASLDRDILRNTVGALTALNPRSGLPYSETETDMQRIIRGKAPASPSVSPPLRDFQHLPSVAYAHDEYAPGPSRRPVVSDFRRAGGVHDGFASPDPTHGMQQGIIGQERAHRLSQFPRERESSGESAPDRRERPAYRARESILSTGSSAGYRSEDSEPKTVAQMYHQGGRHIRG